MSVSDASGTTMQPGGGVQSVLFRRPAELVDISERLYRQVFATGLWVAAAFTAFAVLSSVLEPASSQLRGVIVCAVCLAGTVVAARRAAGLYGVLRRHPWTLVIPAMILGIGALIAGRHNFQLFLPIATTIGVVGIATPRRVLLAAGLIAAAGLAAPQLIAGRSDVAGAIVVIVPPIMFWLIMDRIAVFALRLHQRLDHAAQASQPARLTFDSDADQSAPSTNEPAQANAEPLGLPEPRAIEVDGIRLTSRQLQVVLLTCEGLNHTEMGACLDIGPQQIRRHLGEAKQRTTSRTEPQLAAWARRTGLVPGTSAAAKGIP